MAAGEKYHVNPETGNPNRCYAKKKCRFGGDDDHYPDKSSAREGYEKRKREESSGGTLPSVSRTSPRGRVEPDRTLSHLSPEEKEKVTQQWARKVRVEKEISRLVNEIESRYRTQEYLRKAKVSVEKAFQNDARPVSDYPYGESNKLGVVHGHANDAVNFLARSTPGSGYRMGNPFSYSSSEYNSLHELDRAIELRNDTVDDETHSKEAELDAYYAEADELETEVKSKTGFVENPRFGVPTGENAKDKWKGERIPNYSTPPSLNVPVLKDAERFCTKCNDSMRHDSSKYRWVHSDGESNCKTKDGTNQLGSVNPVCGYCGTGDPAHHSFAQQAYSDESSCSRCKGVSGYGIGD